MQTPIQICRGFTDERWKKLRPKLDGRDEAPWRLAIEVFRRRMEERFFSSIDALVKADSRLDVTSDCSTLPDLDPGPVVVPGFAIMALCCLLAETMQSFHENSTEPARPVGPCKYPGGSCIRPPLGTTDQFRRFLKRPAFRNEFDDKKLATDFVHGIRNGILHNARTRGWLIWRNDPPGRIVERQGSLYVMNRSEFYLAIRRDFEGYLRDLSDPANASLRKRFVERMNKIAKEC